MRRFSLYRTYEAPIEQVWSILADHDGMSRWVGVPVRTLNGDGGVGTIRRIGFPPIYADETILEFDPPRRIVYRLSGPFPVRHHRGQMDLVALPGRTLLTWTIEMDLGVSALSSLVLLLLGRRLEAAADRLSDVLRGARAT